MRNNALYQHEAYDSIKELILTAKLKPGEKVSKRDLSTMLGIGDTPVREAIIRLTKEGLFRVVPQSGTYISKISLKEMQEAQFMRNQIESLMIAQAFDKISDKQIHELDRQVKLLDVYIGDNDHITFFQLDENFHYQFYNITDNHYIWNWMKLINISLDRFRYLQLKMKELNWENINEEHRLIVKHLKKHNKEELMKVVDRHLNTTEEDINLVLANYPDYFEV